MIKYYVSMYAGAGGKAAPTILEYDTDAGVITKVILDPVGNFTPGYEIVMPKENLFTKNEAIRQIFERKWLSNFL